tara:strand:- start:6428 stop:7411 length:984 start_codon:yes stop_codon:yes gene_type:complete
MSGVRYTLIESNSNDIPSNSGALTYNRGINLPAGPIDELVIRFTLTTSASSILADFSNVISSLRIIINGATVHDFRAGYADTSNNAPGLYGYFLNSLGAGRFVEIPNDTAKVAIMRIPIGVQVPAQAVSRLEYTLGYAALQSAASAGTIDWYVRYNPNMQTQTTVSASTSFTHAASEEQVVVRLPQKTAGVVSGLFVQNDSAADQLNGIRLISQSDYSLPLDFYQAFNGDLFNGVLYADDDASTTQLTYAQQVAGGLFIPTFGLSMASSDLVLQVNSSAATTRTYTPVITSPVNAQAQAAQQQTQPVVTNVAKGVLDATTETATGSN